MPLTVRGVGNDRVRSRVQGGGEVGFGRLLRLVLVAGVLLVGFGCGSSPPDTADDDAEVLGSRAALPGKYVSPNGNNANSGTSPDQAYRTVAYAVKQLNPGDTLYVMEGEYFESERPDSAVVVNRSGRADAWITITAFPGATPVLRSNQSNGIKVEGASYVEISNLELIGSPTGGTSSYSGSGINVDAIYGPARNHHVRVLNNTVSGFGAGGIPVTGSSHVEIRNNVVYEVAEVEWSQHSGISILESFNMGFGNDANGYSNYITGNIVYRVENKVRDRNGRFTDGNCIIMDRTNINGYTGRTLIANNLCLDNGGRGIQIFESRHVDVVNNTVYQNLRTPEIASSGGELGAFYSSDVHFANNIVFSRSGLKPARTFDSSGIRFSNNLYVADTAPEYNGAQSSGDRRVGPGTSVVASPSTNPNPSNFELAGGSPAIDAGVSTFNKALGADLAGRTRVAGSAIDLGALESSSTAAATTTTVPAPTTSTTATPSTSGGNPPTTAPPTTAPTTSSGSSGSPTSAGTATTEPSTTATTAVPRPPTTASLSTQPPRTATTPTPSSTNTSSAPGSSSTVAPQDAATGAGQEISQVSPTPATAADAGSTSVPLRPQSVDIDDAEVSEDDGAAWRAAPNAEPTGTIGPIPPETIEAEAPMGDVDPLSEVKSPEAVDAAAGDEQPDVLAFEDSAIPQAPVPVELPLAGAVALALLVSYYRPTSRLGRLLNHLGPDRSNLTY